MSDETNFEDSTAQVDEPLGVYFASGDVPEFGEPALVAPGIWWVRLPITSSLQHVNVYFLQDGDSLTLVDAGVGTNKCRDALKAALGHPLLSPFRLSRVIVTHYHPDHIGLAGELINDRVELWTSRASWFTANMLMANKQLLPLEEEVAFMQRSGLNGIELEAFRRRALTRYSSLVSELPRRFVPLVDAQTLKIGDRRWRVVMGSGHAVEHVSLWSDDCAITGDQILPGISSNLTVPYTEMDVDLIGEWLRSCRRLKRIARNETLCLGGHQRPFYGSLIRLNQIEQNIVTTLERLKSVLPKSATAYDCLEIVYRRGLSADEKRLLLPEVVGMMNHLYFRGELRREIDSEGCYRYSLAPRNANKQIADSDAGSSNAANNHRDHIVDYERLAETAGGQGDCGSDEPNRTSWKRARTLAGVTLACIGMIGFWQWDYLRSAGTEAGPKIMQRLESLISKPAVERVSIPTPVAAMSIVKQSSAEVPREFTGILKPKRISQTGFNRVGVIDEILVARGDRVEADSIMAKLNTNLLQANLRAIQAQYQAADARLSELVAGPRAQTIASARAQVASAKAEVDLAKASANRAERLVKVGAVSQQNYDNAKTELAGKEEALKGFRNSLDELLEGTRSEQVLAQRAQLEELVAAQEQIEVQLEESVLRAPFASIVSTRSFDPGAVASPGVPVFRLVDSDSPEVWIGIPADFLSVVTEKQRHSIRVGKQEFAARYKTVLPELDEVTRTLTVVFELDEKDFDSYLFGQVAKIELARTVHEDGFWVPLSAMTQGDQGLWALLTLEPADREQRGENGKTQEYSLQRTEVEIVLLDSNRAFVKGPLNPEVEIVARGVQRLTSGQRVTIAEGMLQSNGHLTQLMAESPQRQLEQPKESESEPEMEPETGPETEPEREESNEGPKIPDNDGSQLELEGEITDVHR